jgi:hypothetical protein
MLLAPSRAKAGGGGARSARRACRPPGRAKASAGDVGGDGARSAHRARRPLPPIARAARSAEPRSVVAALVVVVLMRRRLRPQWLESTGYGLPYVANFMFQVFYRYVASVLYGRCKRKSECCLYYNGCTHKLQTFVPNVYIFFQTYVVSVII